jgi:intracellular septation protein A
MSQGEQWFGLAPAPLLIVALVFPLCYGIYDFATRGKYNFFSMLGFVSILISGGVGLLELDKDWIAIKEAAIPALFAIAILFSLKTSFPLVRTFLYSPELFDVPKVEAALIEKNHHAQFEKLMTQCTLYLAGSFLMSAVLNYFLAKYFIRSETGSPEFVQEMGAMTFWSYPIIMVPSMVVMIFALNQLINGNQKYTDFDLDDILIIGRSNDLKN